MDLILLPVNLISLLVIIIIITILAVGILKKWMMTYTIILANFLVFILTFIFPDVFIGNATNTGLGFRPMYLSFQYFPNSYTLFTSMFVHSGFLHILGNMIVFFFMGVAFEERIGWKKFLLIYLVTGVFGALTFSVLNLGSSIPLVGASGAVFGILGAFAFIYPRDEVVMPIPVVIMIITKIKVIYAAIIFAAMETIIVYMNSLSGLQDNTAHLAHFGGLISGILLAAVLLKRKPHEENAQGKNPVYYDSNAEKKIKNISFNNLRNLAETPEQKEMLSKIENETVPQVQDIWLEHFIEKTLCPKCKNPLYHLDRRIWCEQCGFRTIY